jgi:hypothetical protein
MFLPRAVPEDEGFGDVDAGVLARRIPDFVHQILNQGQVGPTGVLEVQTPPEEGAVLWVVMDAPPDRDEAAATASSSTSTSPRTATSASPARSAACCGATTPCPVCCSWRGASRACSSCRTTIRPRAS